MNYGIGAVLYLFWDGFSGTQSVIYTGRMEYKLPSNRGEFKLLSNRGEYEIERQ